jgi:ElaB/YqjD/DUF883 family membrane-anchored ribosome-binding protein
MTQRANGSNEVTKDQLVSEFNTVVSETEQLLKSVATAGGEKVGGLRAGVEQSLASARDRLLKLEQATTDKARAAARSTDEYVHANPWQVIGVVAGLAALAAVLLGVKLNRR